MRMSRHLRSPGLALAAVLLTAAPGCAGSEVRRLTKADVQGQLQRLEQTGLLIGEFPLADDAVLDGDTIKVAGLKSTLRLLAIDTEETFKKDKERRLFEEGWDTYLAKVRGDSRTPVKAPTPLGEEAKQFAKKFFDGVKTVRLERDHPKEIRGRFNRYLAYIFAEKDGRWVNYNLECVRAGMSPYFTKYSYSRRFHDEFVAAQQEARAAKLGVWSDDGMHYDDYPVRLVWWDSRAEVIHRFEVEAEGKDNYVVLTHWDALRRLEKLEGQEVALLASVGRVFIGDRGPTRVLLSRRQFSDFSLIFFDKDVFGSSGIERYRGEFIVVRGTVARYRNKHTKREELQIVVNLPGQITRPDGEPAFLDDLPEELNDPPPGGERDLPEGDGSAPPGDVTLPEGDGHPAPADETESKEEGGHVTP